VLFDSHCHLTAEQFDPDRDTVIQRAFDAGVTRILTLGTDVASSRAALDLAERYEGIYAAVGIHPEAINQAKLSDLEIIQTLAAHPKVVAIGEIGLDYYWDKTNAALQQTYFEQQLALAAALHLPVAIHDRDAHEKILETLRGPQSSAPSLRGVLHAFSGDARMAQEAFGLGYLVSFGGPVTFVNNKTTPALVQALPLEKMLIETDSPYLTPHPQRGKRNEPSNVNLIAAKLAALKAVSIAQVTAQTTANACALFAL